MRERARPNVAEVVFYDGDCQMCTRLACWLERRGVAIVPLQSPGVGERLGLAAGELVAELRALTADGRRLDGADAVVAAARRVRWASPLVSATRLPGVMPLLHRLYRRVARRRTCALS